VLAAVRWWIVLAALCGCGGTSAVKDHAQQQVLATHCRASGACGPELRAEPLGDGCYVVSARLYQCTTDVLPVGQLACLDVTPCTGACKQTITVDGRDVDVDHCRPKWDAYRRALHPLTCSAVPVATTPPSLLPAKLDIPRELVTEVQRSGKDRLVYETELCASTAHEPSRSTGFPALDRWLRVRLGEVGARVESGSCEKVTLVLGRFECEIEQSAL
jgi:hypothetical protein